MQNVLAETAALLRLPVVTFPMRKMRSVPELVGLFYMSGQEFEFVSYFRTEFNVLGRVRISAKRSWVHSNTMRMFLIYCYSVTQPLAEVCPSKGGETRKRIEVQA